MRKAGDIVYQVQLEKDAPKVCRFRLRAVGPKKTRVIADDRANHTSIGQQWNTFVVDCVFFDTPLEALIKYEAEKRDWAKRCFVQEQVALRLADAAHQLLIAERRRGAIA